MTTATLAKPVTAVSAPSLNVSALTAAIVAGYGNARTQTRPFRHWLLRNLLPPAVCREIIALPIAPLTVEETYGKRDSHNNERRFFSPQMQERFPVVRTVADAFQSREAVDSLKKLCGVDVKGSFLRIEYCQDSGNFWLEPHMDIKEKFITLQIYLNTGPNADTLGTDLYDAEKRYVATAPGALGEAMLFIPKEPRSFHGFEKRDIPGVRRSLIINYVTDDWRSLHELSFPEQKVS